MLGRLAKQLTAAEIAQLADLIINVGHWDDYIHPSENFVEALGALIEAESDLERNPWLMRHLLFLNDARRKGELATELVLNELRPDNMATILQLFESNIEAVLAKIDEEEDEKIKPPGPDYQQALDQAMPAARLVVSQVRATL